MQTSFDLIVIGAGPGGYVAAIRAAQLGMKVAVVEKEACGGICLNWGCIPTKALLKSAEVFIEAKNAKAYGVQTGQVKADLAPMMQRSRQVANKMRKGVDFLLKKHKITVLMGTGYVLDAQTVQVSTTKTKKTNYKAKHIIIATGARAKTIPPIPLNGKNIIEYRGALSLKQQPKHMLVIGSGALGTEFAYFYHSIGTQVTLVEALPTILPNEDKDISDYMAQHLKKQGMRILTRAKVESVQNKGKYCVTNVGKESIKSDVVLSALGFDANLEDLCSEALGLHVSQGKIVVDDFYRTNVEGIYAIGDVISTPALAHVASAEAIICVEHIAGKHPEALNYNNVPACTYCQPEVASIGYTEAQAKAKGYTLKIGKFPFSASGKSQANGHEEGFVKTIYDAKYGECLGVHMIGHHVTEMIAEIAVARTLETTGEALMRTIHPHPTMSEALMEASAQAYGEAIHL